MEHQAAKLLRRRQMIPKKGIQTAEFQQFFQPQQNSDIY
jgi:hypothetical protein